MLGISRMKSGRKARKHILQIYYKAEKVHAEPKEIDERRKKERQEQRIA